MLILTSDDELEPSSLPNFIATKPCVEYNNGSCDCFDPDDTYKGGAIYYERKYCHLRIEGQAMPDYVEDGEI